MVQLSSDKLPQYQYPGKYLPYTPPTYLPDYPGFFRAIGLASRKITLPLEKCRKIEQTFEGGDIPDQGRHSSYVPDLQGGARTDG